MGHMTRDRNKYFLEMAEHVSTMSTCSRRRVGCVIVDNHFQVMSTGYNGVASGMPHCNEGNPCPAAEAESGADLDGCYAVHAEINALIQCRSPQDIDTIYVSVTPCVQCLKALMNTGCKTIVARHKYPNSMLGEWVRSGRSIRVIGEECDIM